MNATLIERQKAVLSPSLWWENSLCDCLTVAGLVCSLRSHWGICPGAELGIELVDGLALFINAHRGSAALGGA